MGVGGERGVVSGSEGRCEVSGRRRERCEISGGGSTERQYCNSDIHCGEEGGVIHGPCPLSLLVLPHGIHNLPFGLDQVLHCEKPELEVTSL